MSAKHGEGFPGRRGDDGCRVGAGGDLASGEGYVLMLAARFIDFPRPATRLPFIIYIF